MSYVWSQTGRKLTLEWRKKAGQITDQMISIKTRSIDNTVQHNVRYSTVQYSVRMYVRASCPMVTAVMTLRVFALWEEGEDRVGEGWGRKRGGRVREGRRKRARGYEGKRKDRIGKRIGEGRMVSGGIGEGGR